MHTGECETRGDDLAGVAVHIAARVAALAQAVVYLSDQTHSSVARAARGLGFRPDQVRVIPTDARVRMRPDALEGAIAADRADGRRPLMVVANAGTTAAAPSTRCMRSRRSAAARRSAFTSTARTERSPV